MKFTTIRFEQFLSQSDYLLIGDNSFCHYWTTENLENKDEFLYLEYTDENDDFLCPTFSGKNNREIFFDEAANNFTLIDTEGKEHIISLLKVFIPKKD